MLVRIAHHVRERWIASGLLAHVVVGAAGGALARSVLSHPQTEKGEEPCGCAPRPRASFLCKHCEKCGR